MATKPEPENAVVKWLTGKKTYAVALAILVCGVLGTQGIKIPEFAWTAMAAFGLGFLRAGVSNGK